MVISSNKTSFYASVLNWTTRHPNLSWWLLGPARVLARLWAKLPLPARPGVVIRAALGESAFALHRIERRTGRISIGGVDEVLTGSKLLHAMHTVIGARLDPKESARVLYELGEATTRWEVEQGFGLGQWAPPAMTALIRHPQALDRLKTDPGYARFFYATMDLMCRLIAIEGGWGQLSFSLGASGLEVALKHSQEAHWMGSSEQPVCHYFAGVVAGYASALTGQDLVARELECAACGAGHCRFGLYEA